MNLPQDIWSFAKDVVIPLLVSTAVVVVVFFGIAVVYYNLVKDNPCSARRSSTCLTLEGGIQ